MAKFPKISAQLRKSRNFSECPCCMSTFFHPSFIFSMFSSNSYLKSLGEHAPYTLIPSFQSFHLISFFPSTLQIWLQMYWVSMRFLMPYSPSLFVSSYSFWIALFEHGVPYAFIPFLQFSFPNFLANALGAWGSTYPLFPFYILVIVRFNLKEKPQKKTKKTRPKNNPPPKKTQ